MLNLVVTGKEQAYVANNGMQKLPQKRFTLIVDVNTF